MIDDRRAGRLFRLPEDQPSQRVLVHIVYPSRRNVATRTRVVMDYAVELTREISALLARGESDVAISHAGRRAICATGMRMG